MLALLIERYPGMASGMGAPQIRLPTTRSIRPAIAVRYFAGHTLMAHKTSTMSTRLIPARLMPVELNGEAAACYAAAQCNLTP